MTLLLSIIFVSSTIILTGLLVKHSYEIYKIEKEVFMEGYDWYFYSDNINECPYNINRLRKKWIKGYKLAENDYFS